MITAFEAYDIWQCIPVTDGHIIYEKVLIPLNHWYKKSDTPHIEESEVSNKQTTCTYIESEVWAGERRLEKL